MGRSIKAGAKRSAEERFFSKITNGSDPLGCWEWGGNKNNLGYGQFSVDGHPVRAHRWVYEFLRAPIEPGLTIDHECNNRGCVNPWHMDAVTQSENMKRMVRRGRWRELAPEQHVRGVPFRYPPEYRRMADSFADAVDAGEPIRPPRGEIVVHPGLGCLSRHAVALLEHWGYLERRPDGLVVTHPGKATYVADNPPI